MHLFHASDVLTFKTLWNINRNVKIDALLPEKPEYRRARYEKDGEAVRIKDAGFWFKLGLMLFDSVITRSH